MALPTPSALAALIDHAVLRPTQGLRDLEEACALAAHEHVASVCVKPFYVPAAARLLAGTGVLVSTVIGFPHGGASPESKLAESLEALDGGALELDMVINIAALIEGDHATVEREIATIVGAAHARTATVKVILECAYLDDPQKTAGARIAVGAGVDFVKTSTGFGPSGATVADVRLLRGAVGPAVGVKAAGGIKTLDDALAMVDAGANRLGASSTAAILADLRGRRGEA